MSGERSEEHNFDNEEDYISINIYAYTYKMFRSDQLPNVNKYNNLKDNAQK